MNDMLIDERIAGFLRDEPGVLFEDNFDSIVDRVDFHGIAALIYEKTGVETPEAIRQALRGRALAQHFWECEHAQLLRLVFSALATRGIRPLLLKGTSVAYGLYDEPALRARGDSDMLVQPADRDVADAVLRDLGFHRITAIGDRYNHQASYVSPGNSGHQHVIDLHWQIANSVVLHDLFSYEELLTRAVPLPRLSNQALGTGMIDAMLIACMHRQVHSCTAYYVNGVEFFSADRLVWLYDIHLLAATFSSDDWEVLAHLAKEKGLLPAVVDGLLKARASLGTSVPNWIVDGLACGVDAKSPAVYLKSGALQREWMAFRAQDGLTGKVRYFRQMFFPPASYMRSLFPESRDTWVPWLYARRALGGIMKRFRGARAPR